MCSKHGVSGYPTIKYFTKSSGSSGESYEGQRDFKALHRFVRKHSKEPCRVDTSENCNKKEKEYLEELAGHDQDRLRVTLTELQAERGLKKKKYEDLEARFAKEKKETMETKQIAGMMKDYLNTVLNENEWKIKLLEQRQGAKKDEL